MNTGMKIKATLFIALFLILIAVIVYIIGGGADTQGTEYQVSGTAGQTMKAENSQPQTLTTPSQAYVVPDTSEQTVQTADPAATSSAPAVQAPVYTTPSPTPDPTPVPTAEPTPVPQPKGMVISSGTISSNTGSLLNIHADWTAMVEDENNASVTVTVYADSYQLHYTAVTPVKIKVGDNTVSVNASDIEYDLGTLKSTLLGTATVTVPLSRGESNTFPISAQWYFGGEYGDGNGNRVSLETITCEGAITLSR